MTIDHSSSTAKSPPSGPWTGFFLEKHHTRRGWMHLFLNFSESQISGEGTDYVGPWAIDGEFDKNSNECRWTKKYIGKHQVRYVGKFGREGIIGHWDISSILTGNFHIWPANFTEIQEMYLREEDGNNVPGTIPLNPLKFRPDNLA